MTLPETDAQFLARMLLATREGHQISNRDAQRLTQLAMYGPGPVPTTMPEARQTAGRPLTPAGEKDVVEG